MHNNSISAKEKKYIHLQNFKLALSTNEQVLHVKHAGWPLALLQHYFADRFFLFLFHSCISYQGREESNFPVILSRMYIHTATQKQALQTKKKSSLSFCRTGCVSPSSPSCLSSDLYFLVSALCHPTVLHSVLSPHINYSGI